jgi:hypothetical protein
MVTRYRVLAFSCSCFSFSIQAPSYSQSHLLIPPFHQILAMAAPAPGPATGPDQPVSLETIIQQITTPTVALSSLAHTLRTFAPADIRETILASILPGGQDPLELLDPSVNTLGLLYLLYVPERVELSPRTRLTRLAGRRGSLQAAWQHQWIQCILRGFVGHLSLNRRGWHPNEVRMLLSALTHADCVWLPVTLLARGILRAAELQHRVCKHPTVIKRI